MGQQRPDLSFEPKVENPKYTERQTARIGIDAAHHNLHKIHGSFEPFARLLRADGYQVQSIAAITETHLNPLNTLVIANPLNEYNVGNWKRPIKGAFTTEEIHILHQWVKDGGSLLVIADHMPYAGATNELAEAFGFSYADGFVMGQPQIWPPEMYTKKSGDLNTVVLTEGIDSIAGFTGSALKAPPEAKVIATFPNTHKLLIPETAWQFEENTQILDASDYVMGAVMQYGKGKVAFFTEAAMFTAQVVQDQYKVGFNSPKAPQNQRFVLNVMHWLDSKKTEERSVVHSRALKIVQELLDHQAKSFEANKMNEVSACYSKDAIIYEPTGVELRGQQDIKTYWNRLEGSAISWDTEILEVEAIGDQVLAVCKFDIRFKNGTQIVKARSKAILTFKKEDGAYKIFRDFYMPIR